MKTNTFSKKINSSTKTKKLISTVCINIAVCALFIWLARGLSIYASPNMRENFKYILTMYAVFPVLTVIFSAIRIKKVLGETEENSEDFKNESDEDIVEATE